MILLTSVWITNIPRGGQGCPSVVNGLYYPSGSFPQAGSYGVYNLVPLGASSPPPPSPVEALQSSVHGGSGAISNTNTIAIAIPVAIIGVLLVFAVFWFLIKPNFTKYHVKQ